MLRLSSRRVEWTAGRRAMGRGGRPHDEHAQADYRRLTELQDALTRAVEGTITRPHLIMELPDPEIDFEDTLTDSTDPDFDVFASASQQLVEALLSADL